MSKSSTKRNRYFKRSPLALGVASAITLFSASSFAAQSVNVDIEAQRTDKALLELAEESGVQIVFAPRLAQKTVSMSIQGDMPVGSALEQLLQGTSLGYELSGDNTYIVSEQEGEEGSDEGSEEEVDEEIVVTGSAIRNVPPTSQVNVYTAEDIAKLGVSSTEDFIRKLPQNFSGLNTFTSNNRTTQRQNGANRDAVGSSAANLGGLGNDATLILINGRRTAESATFQGGVVNLSSIPLSAIERVEILLDGASARYGSDAIGGVINFITKKDYVGAETSVRFEKGRNGRDSFSLTQVLGYNWGSGGVTATVSYQERDPVSTAKLGPDSFDQTPRGGFNYEAFDSDRADAQFQRDTHIPLTGAVYGVKDQTERCLILERFGISCDPIGRGTFFGYLPEGSDGVNWTAADLSRDNLGLGQFVDLDQGVTSETTSFNLSANQDLTESINMYTEFTYTVNESTSSGKVQTAIAVLVPEENAFNNFGAPVFVSYFPFTETLNGTVPYTRSDSESTRTDLNVGFTAQLPFDGDWELTTNLGYSESNSEGGGIDGAIIPPNTTVRTRLTPEYQARYARFVELLASSDPDVAVNLFGNGSVQSPFFAEVFGPSYANSPASISKSLEVRADGAIFSLPGGDVRMALGLEYRLSERDYSDDILRTNDGVRNDGFHLTEEPSRDETSLFTQFNIPLIDDSNSLPGIQALELEVSARYDEYGIDDSFAIAGVLPNRDVVYEPTGQATFGHVSPRVGFRWHVVDDLTVRGSWTEAFRAPNFTELLGSSSGNVGLGDALSCVFDEDDPRPLGMRDNEDNETCFYGFLSAANPDLDPEISTTTSFGLEWTPSYVDGLSVQLDYRTTDFTDRIASNQDSLPEGAIGDQPRVDAGFFERGTNGRIAYLVTQTVNFASRELEVMELDINYAFSTDFGDFTTGLTSVYTAKYDDQLGPDNPIVNRVGTDQGPEQWRGQATIQWSRGDANVNLFANYSGAYNNHVENPLGVDGPEDIRNQRVGAYVSLDLTANYYLGDGWRISAGADNVTNKSAPFYDSAQGYDPRVYNPTGRLVYTEVKKAFDF